MSREIRSAPELGRYRRRLRRDRLDGRDPVRLQQKLPQLMGLLSRRGFVTDPQILFGAVGDFFADRVPLQIGQFESGIEMDDDLGRLFLEGAVAEGRGDYNENALYFFARHDVDRLLREARQEGYLFLIRRRDALPKATKKEIDVLVGDAVERTSHRADHRRGAREVSRVLRHPARG